MPRLLPLAREGRSAPRFERKPYWLKVRAPGGERYAHLKRLVRSLELHTVCEEASCPNVAILSACSSWRWCSASSSDLAS